MKRTITSLLLVAAMFVASSGFSAMAFDVDYTDDEADETVIIYVESTADETDETITTETENTGDEATDPTEEYAFCSSEEEPLFDGEMISRLGGWLCPLPSRVQHNTQASKTEPVTKKDLESKFKKGEWRELAEIKDADNIYLGTLSGQYDGSGKFKTRVNSDTAGTFHKEVNSFGSTHTSVPHTAVANAETGWAKVKDDGSASFSGIGFM